MGQSGKLIHAFGPFRVDPTERLLLRESEVICLRPKAFDALLVLCQNSQHLLSKEELMEKLWPGTFVDENNLSQNMSLVRKALGREAGRSGVCRNGARMRLSFHLRREHSVGRCTRKPAGRTGRGSVCKWLQRRGRARRAGPTLVIHRTGDLDVKVEEGRYIAEHIPGAKYFELQGVDHLPWVGDQNAALDEVEEFVTGVRHVPEPDRLLATVLAARLVHSDEERVHDEPRWRRILTRYQAHARREIEWFRGRAVASDDERMLATFDGPARAIRCARAISELAGRAGVKICVGLHTGECGFVGEQLTGTALEIASQIATRAGPGEVLVSNTVKGLVAGSGIRFGQRHSRVLDDNAGGRLFTVER